MNEEFMQVAMRVVLKMAAEDAVNMEFKQSVMYEAGFVVMLNAEFRLVGCSGKQARHPHEGTVDQKFKGELEVDRQAEDGEENSRAEEDSAGDRPRAGRRPPRGGG